MRVQTKAAAFFLCTMASVRDKKTRKGKTEKKRVKMNGEEIQAIRVLLGLPKSTSKANLLRAALMFIIKNHKGIDISVY